MIKSINIESNSMIGEYRTKVLSEMERLDKKLIKLSGLYGFEASCLSAWKQTFLDTLWSIFSAMFPVKLREKGCLLNQPWKKGDGGRDCANVVRATGDVSLKCLNVFILFRKILCFWKTETVRQNVR